MRFLPKLSLALKIRFLSAALLVGGLCVSGCQQTNTTTQEQEDTPKSEPVELKLVHWNIESGGNQPSLIAEQLAEFATNGYSIISLSEVDAHKVYKAKFRDVGDADQWQSVLGDSGKGDGRADDRLMILYDSHRLKLLTSQEINRHGDYRLNGGRHRSPLAANFECLTTQQPFLVVQNHLARGDKEFRQEQAKGLREFARDSQLPIIAIGDFNFDYVFDTRRGNPAFVEMMRDGIWKWIEPEELIDTNWYDREKDGTDDYPGSMLDFTFVSGPAHDWDVTSRVIVRDGDFPDNEKSSDHRAVEVLVRF